jgi:hypothetical protein
LGISAWIPDTFGACAIASGTEQPFLTETNVAIADPAQVPDHQIDALFRRKR